MEIVCLKTACAGVVAAALSNEERASEQEEAGEILRQSVVEGESLLLPLLVEQLRSSLKPLASSSDSYFSQSSSKGGQGGTESGEDLQLLAVGLRDSIEFHRQHSHDKLPQKTNSTKTEPLGPDLLMEVQSALSRLQASLKLGSIGEGQGNIIDSAKRDSLLHLVSRLQASLLLPAPPWESKVPTCKEESKHESPEIVLHPPKQAQRFTNKRRQNRHTVAVTREELADARRLIEENTAKEKLASNSAIGQTSEDLKSNVDFDKYEKSSVNGAYELIRQSSAGDLAIPADSIMSPTNTSIAMRAFRPVHFMPRHSVAGSAITGNITAKPFFFLSQLQGGSSTSSNRNQSNVENRRSSCSDVDSFSNKTESLNKPLVSDNSQITKNSSNNVNKSQSSHSEVKSVSLPHSNVTKDCSDKTVPNSVNRQETESIQPMTAVHREYRPGKFGKEGLRPIPKSTTKSSINDSSFQQQSESVTTGADHQGPKIMQQSVIPTSINNDTIKRNVPSSNESIVLQSENGSLVSGRPFHKTISKHSSLDGTSSSIVSSVQVTDNSTFTNDKTVPNSTSHSVSSYTSSSSSPNSKASTPQRSNSGPSVAERLQTKLLSQTATSGSHSANVGGMHNKSLHVPLSQDSSLDSNLNLNEPSSHKPLGTELCHKPVMHSTSLDSGNVTLLSTSSGNNSSNPQSHKPVSHSVSLDSGSSNYDPSILLFTPAQSVQIAVHKAAINKQISIEEEKRQNAQPHSKPSNKKYNSEDSSDDDASSDEERSAETDDEEEEEENTCTVQQIPSITKLGTKVNSRGKDYINNNLKNEDDQMSNGPSAFVRVNPTSTAHTSLLNCYNSKHNPSKMSDEVKNWQTNKTRTSNQDSLLIEHKNKNDSQLLFQNAIDSNWENEQMNAGALNSASYNNPNWQEKQHVDERTRSSVQNVNWQNLNTEYRNQTAVQNVNVQDKNVEQGSQKSSQNVYALALQQEMKNEDGHNISNSTSVSSAQRLLQLATEDVKSTTNKGPGRPDRKVKMKRANTIDIPKPLNFYEIEEESDYSSGEEYEGERGSNCNTGNNEQHRAAYLALRGPIRVGGGNKPLGDKVPPPDFEPKTESDRKFLAFLQQHSDGRGTLWKGGADVTKIATYNPSARGGHHWSNRFSNIKTAFESSSERGGGEPIRSKNITAGPAAARMFWQSADDSVTVMKTGKSVAAANGPKLSRQGSIFLRKLFEQKDQEQQEQQSKLPWTEKTNNANDSVVVGSLTVSASTKGASGSVLSKKQLFTPPTSPTIHAPVNINKFSHAPMSAFRPIEKKHKSQNVEPASQPWASTSGTVKQLASQRFNAATAAIPNLEIPKPTPPNPNKQRVGFTAYHQQSKQESLSPLSPTLPWTRDGIQQDHRVLNTALSKFENLSRETSPQPVQHLLHRSKSQEKIAIPGNLSVFVKQEPIPAPRSYIPPSNPPRSIQGRFPEKTNQIHTLVPPKPPPPIPSPPVLTAPHLIQNYDSNQKIEDKNFNPYNPIYKSYQEQKYDTEANVNSKNEEDRMLHVPEYSTKSYTTEIDYGMQDFNEVESISPIPQTYVVSNSAINPYAYQTPSKSVPEIPESIPEQKSKPDAFESPDASLPSPEVFMAVSRVMRGPQSHQAVTVTQKTRHHYDEMDEEVNGRSSAAKNLSTVLTKFSSGNEGNLNFPNNKSPTPVLRKKEDEEIQSYNKASQKSPTIDRLRQDARMSKQQHLLASSSQSKSKSPPNPIPRHRSEPDINTMMSDEQFMAYQSQLGKKVAADSGERINDSRSPVHSSLSEQMRYSQYASGSGRRLGQSTISGSYPNLPQESMHQPIISVRTRPASTDSLITATSTEELQESGESVLTTRLQIPVCSSGSKVQNLAKLLPQTPRSTSLHNVSGSGAVSETSTSPTIAPSVSPSLMLRKSESWHQLIAGQGIKNKRPQSLALTDLTLPTGNTNSNTRRVPPTLPKTKSSHSLSFPKQFEAHLSPESVENKQRKVEAYLNTAAKSKVHEAKMKVQESQNNSVPPPSDMLVLGENLENVDEAFENLFHASVSSKNLPKKLPIQKSKHFSDPKSVNANEQLPSHLSRSASSQFVRKKQAWEDSSLTKTHLVQNFSHDKSSK
ncbi:hypothetical protein C0J52_21872 [Blattella germanica]|nr:hypothetical protein C0J52_21872 [Blattella germanica]